MKNPDISITDQVFLTPAKFEAIWEDVCPGCKQVVSAIKHDFSLCSQLQNALYRIRELENRPQFDYRMLDTHGTI